MAHFIEPSKRIEFVKARNDYHAVSEAKKKAKTEERRLNGKEVAEFYRELIAETSHTKPSEPAKVNQEKKKTIKKNLKVPSSKEEPLSERDHRLWFKAAASNELQKCKEFIKRGIPIDMIDLWGSTALICAAASDAYDVVEYLINENADLTMKNKSGFSAADLARRKGYCELAEYIESNAAQPEEGEEAPESSTSSQFCEHCNQTFDNIQAHHCSIVHIVNTCQPPRPGYAYGIPASNVGYQLLKETGWKEDRGLGREGGGRKYPMKTTLKRDRKGLGLDKVQPKVTHFEAGDLDAIKAVPKLGKRSYLKELAEKKKREKAIEARVRRAVSDFDEYPI